MHHQYKVLKDKLRSLSSHARNSLLVVCTSSCALVVVCLDVSAPSSLSADYFPRVAKEAAKEAEKEISEKEKLKILFVLTLF